MIKITKAALWKWPDLQLRKHMRTGLRRVIRWLSINIGFLAICCLTVGSPAGAQQTLDDAISIQLDTNCNALLVPDGALALASFGTQLEALCTSGPTNSGGVSAGGGAGTTQTQMFQASVQQRFNELREQGESVAMRERTVMAGFDRVVEMYTRTSRPNISVPAGTIERLEFQKILLASSDPSLAVLAISESAGRQIRSTGIEVQNATSNSDQGKPIAITTVSAERSKLSSGKLLTTPPPVKANLRKLGVWTSVEYEDFDREVTTFEDGYDSGIWRFMVGADYRFTDHFLAGLALGIGDWDGDFDTGGEFDIQSLGLTAYASLFARSGLFVDATLGYVRSDHNRTRFSEYDPDNDDPISGFNKGNYDTNEYNATILAGYPYAIGRVNISPHVGFSYSYKKSEGYNEQGIADTNILNLLIVQGGPTGLELAFEEDDRTSVQSTLGLKAQGSFRAGASVIVPGVFVDWHHEFQDDSRTIGVSFVQDERSNPRVFSYNTQSPDRDFFLLGGEVSVLFDNGFKSFVAIRSLLGHDFYYSTTVSLGLRMDF